MKQRYKSDCECCKFIKQGKDYFGEDCDIFITTSTEKCVVFRYSDRPSDTRALGLGYFDITDAYNFEDMDEILPLLKKIKIKYAIVETLMNNVGKIVEVYDSEEKAKKVEINYPINVEVMKFSEVEIEKIMKNDGYIEN